MILGWKSVRSVGISFSPCFTRRCFSVFSRRAWGKSALALRMIRPAVGDQGKQVDRPDSTAENDSDWIKIQDYVAKLNPKILNDAHEALNRSKWKGEGEVQDNYEEACITHAAALTISCSTAKVADQLCTLLRILANNNPDDASPTRNVNIGGTKVSLLATEGFVRAAREYLKRGDFARISAVDWLSSNFDPASTMSEMTLRGVPLSEQKGAVAGLFSLGGMINGGFLERFHLASSQTVGLIQPAFNVRVMPKVDNGLANTERQEAAQTSAAVVKELVLSASWDDHAKLERLLDKLIGTKGRLGLGLWTLPGGLTVRLVPSDDETGFKSLVLYVPSVEEARERLLQNGFRCHSFPKYVVVACAGLDLRLSESRAVDSYFNEAREELCDDIPKQGTNKGMSCVGAVTQGAMYKIKQR